MWTFLASLMRIIVEALGLWRDQKLRDEGRKEAEAKQNEQAAAVAADDPAVIERVRSRFDRSRQ
jgi:hypothetical protein